MVKRYDFCADSGLEEIEAEWGDWVRYKDYAALESRAESAERELEAMDLRERINESVASWYGMLERSWRDAHRQEMDQRIAAERRERALREVGHEAVTLLVELNNLVDEHFKAFKAEFHELIDLGSTPRLDKSKVDLEDINERVLAFAAKLEKEAR